MKNRDIATLLSEIAEMLELAEENRFKIRAYLAASQTLSDMSQDIEEFVRKETLTKLPGIGEGIARKILEYCATGKIEEHEKLAGKFPSGLLEMMDISGLGPKRTLFLFKNLKIDSIKKLREAARNGQLRELEGFGKKIEENILKGITTHEEFSKKFLHWEARQISSSIADEMKRECSVLEEILPAGSLRRGKESVGDLDFLCISNRPKETVQSFVHLKGVKQILSQGETKASILHDRGVQCDLRVVKSESFGAALLYFTGSKEHNVALRELALKKGLTINEYGLYALSNKKKAIAGRTEEEIYQKLGLEFIPPELRENRGEIEAAARKNLPKLIEEKDVRGDFHSHTSLSDGQNSLEEMALGAEAKGWEWFVTTDHSQSLKVAQGCSSTLLLKKREEVSKLNVRRGHFKVLLGSEVDILPDGRLDYDDETLSRLDFVIASIHSGFSQSEEKMTGRLLSALRNPRVDIIGHLTGRLIGSREPYAVNVQKVLDEACRTKTAMEINGQPQRVDMNDTHAKAAGEMGIPIALSTDAHAASQLDFMSLSVATARRAWLRKEQVLNCMGYKDLLNWKSEVSI